MKFVLKKRNANSKLGRIQNITIDGAQGAARGTSLVAGHADRPLENIAISNLRVTMLPEERPDKRATHALVFEKIDSVTLRNIEVDWDRENPEPSWGSALVLRNVSGLVMEGFRGQAGAAGKPLIIEENVTPTIVRTE
jgi:hypothetical protein